MEDSLKATPSLSMGVLVFFNIPLNEWVLILTALYTIFLIIDKFPTIVNRIKSLIRLIRK